MEKEKSKILVRELQSGALLYECSVDEAEKAYKYAAEMEKLGLDIEVIAPTLSETLSHSLGLSKEAQENYRQSIEEEFESHDGSCCFEDSDKKIIN